jgi:L-asparaginase II
VHHGSAVALGPDGAALITRGRADTPVLPRSALKPLQLVAMLRAGLELPGPLLALSSASHSGETFHLDGVVEILAGAGLDVAALQNTPDLPLDEAERLRWQRAARPASSLAQNCSGKHAAMLATCAINGWPVTGYRDPAHPLQQKIAATVSELAGEPIAATTVDGCGAPAFAISLTALARAFAVLAQAAPDTLEGRVAEVIRQYPQWLGGTGREVTALIEAVPGLIAKDGAEGVYAAALPDGRAVALKIADGSVRARQAVMVDLLSRLQAPENAPGQLAATSARTVLGHGVPVGAVLPVSF